MRKFSAVLLISYITTFTFNVFGQLQISVPDTVFNDTVTEVIIPVQIQGLAGDSVSGFTFTIGFNPDVISIDGFLKDSTLSTAFNVIGNNDTEQSYILSGAGSAPIYNDGVIINLEVSVNAVGNSALEFLEVEINEGEPAFTTKDGNIEVFKQNELPVIQNPMNTIEPDEDFGSFVAVNLDSVFSDEETDSLLFELISYPEELVTTSIQDRNLVLNSIENVFGSGEIIVRATDEEGASVDDTLNINVVSVNDLPQFSNLPDTLTFISGDEHVFEFGGLISDVEDKFTDLTFLFTIEPSDIVVVWADEDSSITITSPDFVGEGTLTIIVTDSDGGVTEGAIVMVVELDTHSEMNGHLPKEFALEQNYPNPFNPNTIIKYSIPEASKVSIVVYDLLGKKVAELVNSQKSAGHYTINFDASHLTSGIYIYQIRAGSFTNTKKMTLIK
ncbi:MAG: T9SS type A sorting domain-containing protein [Candidatus Paceibacterota bacterium]